MDHEIQNWKSFALLLVDVQHDFWSGDITQQFPQFPDNIVKLLKFCRTVGIEVIHIRAIFKPDMSDWMVRYKLRNGIPCVEGTVGAEVASFAQALPGEKAVIKHSFDGFLAPELLPYLQHAGKRFLLVAGLVTSTCVLFTTVSGMQNGFLTAIVEDCCADEPSWHEHTLNTYQFIFKRTRLAQIPSDYEKWLADLRTLSAIDESISANNP